MRAKIFLVIGLAALLLLSGCRAVQQETTAAPSEPPELSTWVSVSWSNFVLTNDKGQQLVMDLSETDYPEGDMPRGNERVSGSEAYVSLNYEVPASSYYELECEEKDFTFIVVGDYSAFASGERVTGIRLSESEVSLTGRDTDVFLSLSAQWELRVQGHADATAVMSLNEELLTIEGLTGDYKFWATDYEHSGLDSYAIEGTARTGTLTVDLSRLETEKIVTITDGDEVTEHKVKMP